MLMNSSNSSGVAATGLPLVVASVIVVAAPFAVVAVAGLQLLLLTMT
jgi:hypothetical protein